MRILTVNTGSSSLKLALFVKADRVGGVEARDLAGTAAFKAALDRELPRLLGGQPPEAIGHRVVAPIGWRQPQPLDAARLAELRGLVPMAPDHLPQALAAIAATVLAFPGVPQVACSDSAFHHTLPPPARKLPLPRALQAEGVVRYGYHGLSCEYILSALRVQDARLASSRIVIAHLGHGCSLTAVRGGQSLDTTMGFTPLGGVPMSTRSGDLDPGVVLYLLRQKQLSTDALSHMLNQESGLAGVSGISGDMKALLALSATRPEAAEAVEMFVYQVAKAVGAMAAVLGGLDLLVFTGGIGENAAEVRDRIAARLGWLPAEVRVIATDEDRMIARHTARWLAGPAAAS